MIFQGKRPGEMALEKPWGSKTLSSKQDFLCCSLKYSLYTPQKKGSASQESC